MEREHVGDLSIAGRGIKVDVTDVEYNVFTGLIAQEVLPDSVSKGIS
jgi:hypothetical protein